MSLPRYLFMAEANGMDNLVTTRTARINAVINYLKKYIKQGKDINDTIQSGKDQIEEKKYDVELIERGCTNIHKMVFAFKGKDVTIEHY